MKYKTVMCIEDELGKKFSVGHMVTIKYLNGGGCGGCKIEKITNTGFHFSQGTARVKSVQYKNIAELY